MSGWGEAKGKKWENEGRRVEKRGEKCEKKGKEKGVRQYPYKIKRAKRIKGQILKSMQ